MKKIATVFLLSLTNKEINDKNINEVLNSVGVKPNAECVKLLVAACKGKKPEELIKEGASKLVTVTATAGAPAEHNDDKKKDDKKGKKEEKKKPEKKPVEEEDDGMDIGGLF